MMAVSYTHLDVYKRQELTQKINGLIKEMSEDGTIGSIAEKYGLDAEKVVIRGGSDEK